MYETLKNIILLLNSEKQVSSRRTNFIALLNFKVAWLPLKLSETDLISEWSNCSHFGNDPSLRLIFSILLKFGEYC